QSLDGGDQAAAVQFHTVLDGGLDHGQGKAPGIDDAGGGGVQSAADFGGEGGLHGAGFLPGQQPQFRHAVGHAPAVQRFQRGPALGGEANHQRAAPAEGHVQLLADLGGHAVALHVQGGHEGAGFGVVARVDDGAVCLGGAVGHIVAGFQHGGAQAVARQPVGGGGAHNAAADD